MKCMQVFLPRSKFLQLIYRHLHHYDGVFIHMRRRDEENDVGVKEVFV